MRKLIRKLVQFKPTWAVLSLLYRVAYRFKFEKDLIELENKRAVLSNMEVKLKSLFSELKVLHGPFKGMIYPDFKAHGSSLYAKLLGSYESELHEPLEQLLRNNYATIVDVGCAEGYYAVGLALRIPSVKVLAYDLDKPALDACRKMAALNKVQDRVQFGEFCSSDVLSKIDFKGRGLVVSDCEGFEMELFTPASVANLKNCDILIEMHDLYNEKITPAIEEVFMKTHNIQKVYSESTFKRLKAFPEAAALSEEEIKAFMLERNGIMAWAIVTPK